MNEYRTQRNAIWIAVGAVAAIAVGFFLGRSGRHDEAQRLDDQAVFDTASPATATASAAEPVEPSPASPSKPTPPAYSRPSATGSTRPVEVGTPPSSPSPSTSEPRPTSVPAAPVMVTIPAGTKIELEMRQPLSSQTASVGDSVVADVVETIWVDGRAAIPAGSVAQGTVTEARPLPKIGGKGLLAFAFREIQVPGESAPIVAAFRQEGKSETAKDAATIAAGAAVGTVVGNQAKKNDQGKVIGGLIGAAIGTVIAAKTDGTPVEIPAGSHLVLTLQEPVEVRLHG